MNTVGLKSWKWTNFGERGEREKRQIGMDLVLQVFLRKPDPKGSVLLRD